MIQNKPLPIVILSCRVFEHLFVKHLSHGFAEQVTFLDYGLHQTPRKLKETLQQSIDGIKTPSLIVLGYGLCGNGVNGLKSGIHTLLAPRSDDCIGILLGSPEKYRQLFFEGPPTYYLSVGWLESGSNPLREYQAYVSRYGEEKAMRIMDTQYRNYRRLAFVAHTELELEQYRPKALEVAEFCARWGMVYEEMLGSEDFIRDLISTANDRNNLKSQFIQVNPGGQLLQQEYLK